MNPIPRTAYLFLLATLLAIQPAGARPTPLVYFVSSSSGNDSWDGLAPAWNGVHGPFQSIARVSGLTIPPGTSVYFKRGDVWNEQLTIHGDGTYATPNFLGAYGSGPNPKIHRNSDQSDTGIHFQDPNYWTVSDFDFEQVYRGIDVVFTRHGNYRFSVKWCNFSHSPYVSYDKETWPTKAGTGVSISAPFLGEGYALDELTISGCRFTDMGQGIGLHTRSPGSGHYSKLSEVTIENCVMEDGAFIQLTVTGVETGVINNTKVWNNGVNIENGPANVALYDSRNFVIQDSELAYDQAKGSPIDGDGIDMAGNENVVFRRVLFHHNDAVAIVTNHQPSNNIRFEDCVFAGDELADPVNPLVYPQEAFGEIRLHQAMSGTFIATRFLPRLGFGDIVPVNGSITFTNTTTSDVADETRGPDLMLGASSATQNPTTRTWEYVFTNPITVNEVILGEVLNAGTNRFFVQYWDALTYTWKDVYSGKTIVTLYDKILPFPTKTTTRLRVSVASNTSGMAIGLSQFEAYYVKGKEYNPFPNSDFEAGIFDGWIRSGTAFPHTIPRAYPHDGMDPLHVTWWGDSDAGGEPATGTLTSSTFALKTRLKLSLAGWDGQTLQNNNFLYVKRASDNTILFTARPPQTAQWSPVEWDTTPYYGVNAYVVLVDGNSTGSYAWLALDDLRVVDNAPPATPAHSDEFTSSILDPAWNWVRQNSARWFLYDTNPAVPPALRTGSMRITITGQELWGLGGTTENILLRSIPSGDWTAMTRLNFAPANDYQQAGLILYSGDIPYSGDDNYIKLVYTHDSSLAGGLGVEFAREAAGNPTNSKLAVNNSAIYLRLVKSGTTYTGSCSTNGTNWTQVSQFAGVNLLSPKIGIIAQGVSGATASFVWFDVR